MSTLTPTSPRWRALSGGTAVWVFMSVELATFGMFLLAFAWGYAADPAGFSAAQDRLHPVSGLRGTALLLLASGAAYHAVLAHTDVRQRACEAWLWVATALGLAFTANKVSEYLSPDLAGINLSTGAFWFYYLFLTGLHLLHVVGGLGFFVWLAVASRRKTLDTITLESGAAYWHLVDVVWLLLFPILYLMRG